MATITTTAPALNIIMTGTNVTAMNKVITFTLDNKIEDFIKIKAADSWVTLDLTNVETMYILMIECATDILLRFTQTIVVITPPSSTTSVISFPITGGVPYILPTSQAFIDSLDSICISTASTTDVQVSIKAYGKVVTTV